METEQIPALINDPALEVVGHLKAMSFHLTSQFANIPYIVLGISSKIWGSSGSTRKGNHVPSK